MDHPALRRMRSHAEHQREIELARARRMLANGDDPVKVLEALGARLTNKLLHPPLSALQRAPREQREELARSFVSLYPEAA